MAALAESLSRYPTVGRVRLESGGGLLDEAEEAARLIHAHHLDTVVSGDCSSACTVIFVAGIHRQLDAAGKLGFHALQQVHPDADIYIEQSLAYAPLRYRRSLRAARCAGVADVYLVPDAGRAH
jgi:hypothetical protein